MLYALVRYEINISKWPTKPAYVRKGLTSLLVCSTCCSLEHEMPVEQSCVVVGFVLISQLALTPPSPSTHSIFLTCIPVPQDTEHFRGRRRNREKKNAKQNKMLKPQNEKWEHGGTTTQTLKLFQITAGKIVKIFNSQSFVVHSNNNLLEKMVNIKRGLGKCLVVITQSKQNISASMLLKWVSQSHIINEQNIVWLLMLMLTERFTRNVTYAYRNVWLGISIAYDKTACTHTELNCILDEFLT